MTDPLDQQMRALERAMQRRARADLVMIAAAACTAALLAGNSQSALMLGICALSIGILLYVIRRGRDASALARISQRQLETIADLGISLSEWHSGDPLPDWTSRKDAHDEAAGAQPPLLNV